MSEDHEKLRTAVERHLPMTARALPDSDIKHSDGIALLIAGSWMRGAARYGRWDGGKEAAKLDDLEEAIDGIECLLGLTDCPTEFQLSPAVRDSLLDASARNSKRLPLGPYGTLRDALGAIRKGLSTARDTAAKGGPKGKRLDRHYDAIVVAEKCAELWKRHVGVEPPSSVSNATPGPFARFLSDVFQALDIRVSPQGALRSLKQLRGD